MSVKSLVPECHVSGALGVVLRVSRYAGVAPLSLQEDGRGWRARFSSALNTYGYCLVTILNICVYITMIKDMSLNLEHSVHMQTPTRRIVCIVDLHLGIVTTSISVYGVRRCINTILSCLTRVRKILNQLQIQHANLSKFTERQKSVFVVSWMILTVFHVGFNDLLLAVKYDITNPEHMASFWTSILYMSYYVCFIILQLQILQFFLIALQVLYAFRAINYCLRNVLKDNSSTLEQPQHQVLRSLRSQYSTACCVVRDVTRSYGPVLLLLLGSFLLHLVLSPYYLINTLCMYIWKIYAGVDKTTSFTETPYNVAYVVIQLFWSIHHAFNLLMIIEPCHNTHSEMETTRSLVSALMMKPRSTYEPAAVELELFYRLLLVDRTSYSPLKVTTLTRSLVIAIFGSVTTYLIILLQL